jgi:hypothetical protein
MQHTSAVAGLNHAVYRAATSWVDDAAAKEEHGDKVSPNLFMHALYLMQRYRVPSDRRGILR